MIFWLFFALFVFLSTRVDPGNDLETAVFALVMAISVSIV